MIGPIDPPYNAITDPAFNVKSESELHSIGVTEWYSLKTK
jgi:hypothetical protein